MALPRWSAESDSIPWRVYPEWFGTGVGTGDEATDTAAVQAAIEDALKRRADDGAEWKITFGPKTYSVDWAALDLTGVNYPIFSRPTDPADAVTPEMFGAVEGGVLDCSLAFQRACNYVQARGGGRVYVRAGRWLICYPVFVQDHTELCGAGAATVVVVRDPTFDKGRGGFVVGSSREANRETALAAYADGSYQTGATTHNPAFTNPAIGQYLRDNPDFIQARNSSVHDLYLIAEFTTPGAWGGYGVIVNNCLDCRAYNLDGEGWTQLVGMGSDVVPETPSNHRCDAWGLRVVKPDLVHSFYTVGFIANSTSCSISGARQYAPCTDGTPDGSGVALAACEDCTVEDVVIENLGRTATSEGVLVQNSKRITVKNVSVRNAKSAVADFSDPAYYDQNKPNVFEEITGIECDQVASAGNKYTRWSGITNVRSTYDLRFLNSNTSGNIVDSPVSKLRYPGDLPDYMYLILNQVKGTEGEINPEIFGAVPGGTVDCSLAFQNACRYIHEKGGGRVRVRAGRWLIAYPVFVLDNTELVGDGISTEIIGRNPKWIHSRAVFVLGSSAEANRAKALANYESGAYLSEDDAISSTHDLTFVNPAVGQWLDANPQFIYSRNSTVRSFKIVADWTYVANAYGGYAVIANNTADCRIEDIWTDGFTQGYGAGSDSSYETPGNVRLHIRGIRVLRPDPVVTYFAGGFCANSKDSLIEDIEIIGQCSATSDPQLSNNVGLGLRFSDNVTVRNVKIHDLAEVGAPGARHGMTLTDCIGCTVENFDARIQYEWSAAVVEEQINGSDGGHSLPGFPSSTRPNVIRNVTCREGGYSVILQGKYSRWSDLHAVSCPYDIGFGNYSGAEATGNVIDGTIGKVAFPGGGHTEDWYLENNIFLQWRSRGVGSPEGVVRAPLGAEYLRTDGGAGTTKYLKESASGTTGWAAK